MPHREGRRLDQARQRLERRRAPVEPRRQRGGGLLRLGDVDEPEQGRALGEAGRGRRAVDAQEPGRARRAERDREAAAGRGVGEQPAELGGLGRLKRRALAEQPHPARRQPGDAERAGQPVRAGDRAVRRHHQRQSGRVLQQRREPAMLVEHRLRAGGAAAAPEREPEGRRQPGARDEGERRHGDGRQRDHAKPASPAEAAAGGWEGARIRPV